LSICTHSDTAIRRLPSYYRQYRNPACCCCSCCCWNRWKLWLWCTH